MSRLSLTGRILIALVLGLLVGVAFHYLVPAGPVRDDVLVGGVFYLVGQGFIRLMQMLVVPLVFCSIVCRTAMEGGLSPEEAYSLGDAYITKRGKRQEHRRAHRHSGERKGGRLT